uniref:USP domain-containing protein n=1 Tax=Chromera velia CCMP2878 TaxID=1169474 RepID=A0A0G4FG31_9ALVE|eukprot:Cvel_16805.t1-p1 / transcript=Cvel_16805.t1 / gene=Cvel_16805 / organism=Chromera_velia_CCMP2878 / gene_product=hypothetical protein / transcript_product=hypothetical protein / location=Cvel_scaffold1312:32716-35058(+) / protein_length=781 / sequence_SO=supercontig / SO=protein_coding / is_pseudo=false
MKAEGWSGAGEDVDACLRETFESLRKVNEFLRPNQRPSPDFAAGLPNFQADIRNACFANAAFQLLAASDSYRSTAVQLLHSPFVADSPTRAVVLGILIVGLRDSRLRLQAASRIHQALPRFPNFRRHQDTRTGQVHCSHEFMITVLDLMDKNQTAPPRIETCDCYKCKSCGWVRESRKITGVPMVEIPIRTVESQQQQQQQGVSWTLENGIGEAMEQGKAGEWKGAREYDERCGNPDCPFFDGTEKVKNAFCQKIIYPPQTVLFHINRTVHSRDGLVMGKDTRHLEFGRTLDLGPFLCDRPSSGSSGAGSSVSSCTEDEKRERGGEVLYRLVGGVVHLGSRCASGHFRIFAFARRSCDVEVPYGQTEETRVVCLDAEAGREGRLNPFLVFDDAACPVARPWKELSKKEASLLLYEKAPAGYTRERETEGGVDREESKGEGKDAEGYEGGVGVTDAAEPANDPSASFALTDDALQMQHISVGEERDREAKREGETGEGGFSCSLLEGSGVEEGDLSGGQEKECEDNSPSTVSVAPRGAKVLLLHLFELEEQAEMGDVSDCSSATSSPMGSRAPSEAVSSPPLSPLASATLRELGWDLEAGVERYHQREESEETAYLFESLWKEKTRRLLLSAQRRDLVIFFLAFLSFFFGILGFLVLFRGPVLLPLSSSPSSFLVLSRRVGEEFFPAAVTAGCVWGGVGICFSFLFSAFTRADGKEKREVRRRKAGGDTGWQGRRAGLTGLPLLDCPDRPPESWKEAHQCWQEFEHRRWRSAFRTVLSFLSL